MDRCQKQNADQVRNAIDEAITQWIEELKEGVVPPSSDHGAQICRFNAPRKPSEKERKWCTGFRGRGRRESRTGNAKHVDKIPITSGMLRILSVVSHPEA